MSDQIIDYINHMNRRQVAHSQPVEQKPIQFIVTDAVINSEVQVCFTWDGWIRGTVYPIWDSSDEVLYQSKQSSDSVTDKADAKVLFTFLFCWRGVWEGRIYFPDGEEYWSEELIEIASVWGQLQVKLKDFIKAQIPDNMYDD